MSPYQANKLIADYMGKPYSDSKYHLEITDLVNVETIKALGSQNKRLREEIQSLKAKLKDAEEVVEHYNYPDVGMTGQTIYKSGCVANDYLNKREENE